MKLFLKYLLSNRNRFFYSKFSYETSTALFVPYRQFETQKSFNCSIKYNLQLIFLWQKF